MKILILGGTRFFGYEIADQLSQAGHAVTVFSRSAPHTPFAQPVRWVRGDRKDFKDLTALARLETWDLLIDNIAFSGDDVRSTLAAFSSVPRYFLTSTISVYRYVRGGHPRVLVEDEVDHTYTPDNEDLKDEHWAYARGKLDAEAALLQQTQTKWTIFRPTIVYGPRDPRFRGYWYLARLMEGKSVLSINGGLNAFRLVLSSDIPQAITLAMGNSSAHNEIYNLAQGEVITLKEFVDESAQILGTEADWVPLPGSENRKHAGPLAMDRDWNPSIDKAMRELKFMPTSFSTFVRGVADWFVAQPESFRKTFLAGINEEEVLARKYAR